MDIERRQEPYWVWACPICKRQLRDTFSTCCDGSFGMTVYCVPDDLHRGAVEALRRIAGGHVQHRAGQYDAAVAAFAQAAYDAAIGGGS